ncbi:MAG: outer membrane beta-barrel protein [Gammaproteobacteria bacterium]|nr:outer membrane beta-barrel protein [Gammaproteobacteria bacterium]
MQKKLSGLKNKPSVAYNSALHIGSLGKSLIMRACLILLLVLSAILAQPVQAQEKGDILFRLGAVHFDPGISSSPVNTTSSGFLADSGVAIKGDAQLGFSLGYMLSNSLAVEANVTAPFEHDLYINGLEHYGLNTAKLGEAKQVPPTVSALYYFGSTTSRFRPYIGAGLTYTRFFDHTLATQIQTEFDADGLFLDDDFGLALRAGFDWKLGNGWHLSTSVWRINTNTNASFDSRIGPVSTYVEMDPWAYSITLGHTLDW